jgi:enoyl-CoA hydratase/carnithine racemase
MLRIDDGDRVRTLTLDRPDALNAFNSDLYSAVATALTEAAGRADLAVVLLTGTGRAFSAGQDLAEMSSISEARRAGGDGGGAADEPAAMPHGFGGFMDVLSAFPKPLIAAVNGLAVGIGLTLLGHCDLVLVSEEARLRAPFVSLGVVPEAASSYLLAATVGWQAAARVFYTAEWVSADEAVALGLALGAYPADELLEEASALARAIAAMPISSLVATKRLMLETRLDLVRAARVREDAQFAELTGGPANREALAAFLEKRPADFSKVEGA